LRGDTARQREQLRDGRLAAMEGGVEQAICGTPGRAACIASMPARL
jgi:hypothetical protein